MIAASTGNIGQNSQLKNFHSPFRGTKLFHLANKSQKLLSFLPRDELFSRRFMKMSISLSSQNCFADKNSKCWEWRLRGEGFYDYFNA